MSRAAIMQQTTFDNRGQWNRQSGGVPECQLTMDILSKIETIEA